MVEIELYGTVGEEISMQDVKSKMNAAKGQDIIFKIATMGGDISHGIVIHDLIKEYSGKTKAEVTGLTASAGTVIAIACDKVEMSENSLFLIHNAWTETIGNIYDVQKTASELAKNDAIMIKMYKEKTGLSEEKIRSLMKASDWLTPGEAVKLNLVDSIKMSTKKIAANAIVAQVQNDINNELLIKLKRKMKIFGKEKKDVITNVVALADKSQLLINAEEVATGVEIAPLGASTLEDGTFDLADGRKITIAGGVVTEVIEKEEEEEEVPAAEIDAIVGAVNEVVEAAIEKVEAKFQSQINALKGVNPGAHQPPKGRPKGAQAKVDEPDVHDKVKAKADAIRAKLVKEREG